MLINGGDGDKDYNDKVMILFFFKKKKEDIYIYIERESARENGARP